LLRRNVQDKSAVLNCLEPVDESLVVCGIDPIEDRTTRFHRDVMGMYMRQFCPVMIFAGRLIVDMSERGFDEAHQ
jgi:hypothetical protein